MSAQAHEKTEEELGIALELLIAIAATTDDSWCDPWHQSLQSDIQGVQQTIIHLQRQAAIDRVSMIGGM